MLNITTIAPPVTAAMLNANAGLPAIRIIDICILLISIIGNGVVIIAIVQNKKLEKSSLNYLVLNLSICSILVVVTTIPFTLISVANDNQFLFGSVGCHILYPLGTMSTNASVFTLLCITIDRYMAISRPLSWRNPKAHVSKAIALTYIYSIITVLPFSVNLEYSETTRDGKKCNEIWSVRNHKAYTVVLFLLQYGIPLPVMVILYSWAWWSLKRQNDLTIQVTRRNRSVTDPSLNTENELRRIKEVYTPTSNKPTIFALLSHHFEFVSGRQKKSLFVGLDDRFRVANDRRRQTIKTFLMFSVIIIIFAVSFLPNQIYWLYLSFYPEIVIGENIQTAFYVLCYSNCVLNPIIYGGLNQVFWKGYKRIMCCSGEVNGTRRSNSSKTSRSSSQYSWRSSGTTVTRQTNLVDIFEGGILTNNPVQVITVGSLASDLDVFDSDDSIEIKTRRISKKYSINPNRNRAKFSFSQPRKAFRKLTLPLLSAPGIIQTKQQNVQRKYSVPVLNNRKNVHRSPSCRDSHYATSVVSSIDLKKGIGKSSTMSKINQYLSRKSNSKRKKSQAILIEEGECSMSVDNTPTIMKSNSKREKRQTILIEEGKCSMDVDNITHSSMKSNCKRKKSRQFLTDKDGCSKLENKTRHLRMQSNFKRKNAPPFLTDEAEYSIKEDGNIDTKYFRYSSSEEKLRSLITESNNVMANYKRNTNIVDIVGVNPDNNSDNKKYNSENNDFKDNFNSYNNDNNFSSYNNNRNNNNFSGGVNSGDIISNKIPDGQSYLPPNTTGNIGNDNNNIETNNNNDDSDNVDNIMNSVIYWEHLYATSEESNNSPKKTQTYELRESYI